MSDEAKWADVIEKEERFLMSPCRGCGRMKPADRSCPICREVAAYEAFTEALMDIRRMLAKRWEADGWPSR